MAELLYWSPLQTRSRYVRPAPCNFFDRISLLKPITCFDRVEGPKERAPLSIIQWVQIPRPNIYLQYRTVSPSFPNEITKKSFFIYFTFLLSFVLFHLSKLGLGFRNSTHCCGGEPPAACHECPWQTHGKIPAASPPVILMVSFLFFHFFSCIFCNFFVRLF